MLKHAKWLNFIFAFLVIWLYSIHIDIQNFVYDSSMYWESGSLFSNSGTFSWLTYDQPLRGYILPFLSYLCMATAKVFGVSALSIFKLASALFYSFFLAVLIPSLYEKLTGSKLKLIQIFCFFVLVFYFWRGYFLYPLSDFVSLFFVLVTVYALISFFENRKFQIRIFCVLLAGIFLALSTLARPSYQIIILPMIIFVIVYSLLKKIQKRKIFLFVVAMTLGMSIGYSPQIYINQKNYGVLSPFVQTDLVFKDNLFVNQLLWGLYMQKYESNTNLDSYPSAGVYFYDQQGINLLDKEKIIDYQNKGFALQKEFTMSSYVGLIMKYPLDMITIYTRHIFNGLDLMHHSVYLTDVYKNRILFSFLNYTSWFVSLVAMIRIFCNRALLKRKHFELVLIVMTILPSVLSIPGAIESRFFLPIFLLNYVILSYYLLSHQFTLQSVKIVSLKYAIPYVLFLLICFTWSSMTFGELSQGHYLFNN
ncbi:hypothetical protein [Paenibacillus sp. NPDC057934]|uniref:hypothetical protein n=1 Tax=Paenibacillus sp. NPDC057934 TaxID=3346282 RepID=UPI0036DB5DE9